MREITTHKEQSGQEQPRLQASDDCLYYSIFTEVPGVVSGRKHFCGVELWFGGAPGHCCTMTDEVLLAILLDRQSRQK